ncbi:aromatic acid exporter family protein [Corynebacterium sp.]|uniref:FUSC family protein n=1 Tax=Corynebacterium sp. TaxID=1720 RepID=UPI0026DD2619|nr:FUSC family protein [Corynebacterium sp.]MDO5032736.1 FUSC family protein [Corynebacterium sp.]
MTQADKGATSSGSSASAASPSKAHRVRLSTREQLRVVDRSLKARIARVRYRLVFILQCTLGAGLAYYVAYEIFGHTQPFFAPMAVIIILGLSGKDRVRRAFEMAFGGIAGVAVGTVLVDTLGTGVVHLTIIIGLALLIGSFVTSSQLVTNQIVIAAILIATILPPEEMGGLTRATDAVIGAVIGLAMIMLIPTSPLRAGRVEVSKVLGVASSVLSDVALGLRDDDPSDIEDARAAVVGTQNTINSMLAAAKGGAETARLSPFLWSTQRTVRSLERILTPVDNVLRSIRVLSRRALVLSQDNDTVTTEQIELIDELADITYELSVLYSHQSAKERRVDEAQAIPELVKRLRQLAARATMDVVNEESVLSAYALLAQTRSIIVDLLMICGMSRESAVAQLAPTSESPAFPPEVWEGD